MFENSELREIRSRWKEIYPAAKKKGIICPLCGNGSGADGDGIVENPKSRNHSLKCFKCPFSGDVIDLKMQEKGLTFIQAVRECEGILGMMPADSAEGPNRAGKEKDGGIAAADQKTENEAVQAPVVDYLEYFWECMERLNDPEAVAYLKSRGITPERATQYCGYDPAWISPTAAERARKEGKPLPYPSKRIIIWSSEGPEGKLNHYVARAIEKNSAPKMNETGNGTVGIMNFDAILSGKPVFITEGPFDALSIMETGAAALSLNSTSNVDVLIGRLKALEGTNRDDLPNKVFLCCDRDESGNKATETLKAGFKEMEIEAVDIREQVIFTGKDANEALVADRERFVGAVKGVNSKEPEKPGILSGFIEEIQGEAYRPLETGEKWFDDLLGGGVIRQTLLLLMAAPGAGKTTLCQQLAENMAASGRKVVFLNLEMSKQQMYGKALARRLYLKNGSEPGRGFSTMDILQGYKWTENERKMILEEAVSYEKEVLGNLVYNPENVGTGVQEVEKYLTTLGNNAREKGEEAPVIVLDYLHLLTGQGMDVQELIKKAVMILKDYAKNYNTFCLAIAASNRAANKKNEIDINSGRDSSGIEYSADYLLGMERVESDTKPDAAGKGACSEVSLKVHKSRFSQCDKSIILNYDKQSNYFWKSKEEARKDYSQYREAGARRGK